MSHYFSFFALCSMCGRRFTAETRLVLGQKVTEHEEGCAKKLGAALRAMEAKARQGRLF